MRLVPLIFVLFVGFGVFAQDAELLTGPKIAFDESSHDFGDIYQGDKVEYTFTYANTGVAPLILADVRTSCGCTATNWDREPLPPGESASITVKFNSTGKIGMQNKVVTIMSNAENNPERIKITTNILKPEPGQ